MEKIIKILEKEIDKAIKKDEIPVASLIVVDGKIISKAFNQRHSTNDITKHAEISAIRKAAKVLGSWKMPEAIIYSTLEPCTLCMEAIKHSRIKKVIYFSQQNKTVDYKISKEFVSKPMFGEKISKYFKNKR